MSVTRPSNARTKGSILFMVLIICVISVIVGTGLLVLGFESRMTGIRLSDEIAARMAADAAIAHAVYKMNEKLKIPPWDDSSLPALTNGTMLSSDVTFDYIVYRAGGVYSVRGTGRGTFSSRTVESTLRLFSPFDYAVFTRSDLELKSNTVIDWYNNQPGDWPLQVGTTSTQDGSIVLMSNTIINGDILVGAGGDPAAVIESHASVTVNGRTYPMIFNPDLPAITVPGWLVSMSSGDVINSSVSLSASGKYDEINLGNGEKITVTEPIALYVTGDVTLGNDANIIIGGPSDTDNDASLVIYLAGNLEGKNSAGFNNLTMDSKRLYIYCLDTCESFALKNDADFRGAIYAPNASVDLDNKANIYGSIVSDSFVLRNSATVFYDAALRDRTVSDDAVRFVIHRWSE